MSQPSQPVQPAHSAAGAQTASSAADSTANSAVMSSAPQSSVTATGSTSFTPKAKVQLFSLALLSFSLGMSQFLIVGMMPSVSAWLRQGTSLNASASSEQAAQLTAMYSIGIIVGLLLLLLARKLSARWYMVVMGALITVSNLLTFIFGNASTGLFGALLFSRVLAGLPHGSFFGANSLICPRLSPQGQGRTGTEHRRHRSDRRGHHRHPDRHRAGRHHRLGERLPRHRRHLPHRDRHLRADPAGHPDR